MVLDADSLSVVDVAGTSGSCLESEDSDKESAGIVCDV